MRTVFKNAMVFREKGFEKVDIAIENKKPARSFCVRG